MRSTSLGRPISVYSSSGSLVGDYPSIADAARELDMHHRTLYSALNRTGYIRPHKLWVVDAGFPVPLGEPPEVEGVTVWSLSEDNTVTEYASVADAERRTGATRFKIRRSASSHNKSKLQTKGYYFFFGEPKVKFEDLVRAEKRHVGRPRRKVGLYDLNGTLLREFPSMRHACDYEGVSAGTLRYRILNNIAHKGHYFCLLGDFQPCASKSRYRSAVVGINPSGERVEYHSALTAAKWVYHDDIPNCGNVRVSLESPAKAKRTAGGYAWFYLDEEVPVEEITFRKKGRREGLNND